MLFLYQNPYTFTRVSIGVGVRLTAYRHNTETGGLFRVEGTPYSEPPMAMTTKPVGSMLKAWAKEHGLEAIHVSYGVKGLTHSWEFSPIVPNFDEMYALYHQSDGWYVEVGPGEQGPDNPSPFRTLSEALRYLGKERADTIKFLDEHPEERENRP